ncbi:MAG: SDR family oxidoreductase [Dehalococcoidales bacterium]
MLGITGATGKLGAKVAARLEKSGQKQRLIVRDAARAPRLSGAEIAEVPSYGDKPAMKKALSGVKTLFLVSARDIMGMNQAAAQKGLPPPRYSRLQEQTTAIDAAVEAGVKHIVYLSFLNAMENATFVLSREHYHTEQYIRDTGLSFTFLRPCLYLENVPLRVSEDGIIRAPAGNGRAAWVTRDDIADVAAAVLTGKGHEGRIYDVTGPEALTMAETAARISTAAGRKVTYIAQPTEETRALHNANGMDKFEAERRALTGKGLEDYEVEIWVTHYLQIAAGDLDVVSDTVPKLTGHQAQSLAEYLRLHPESYRHITGGRTG